MSLVVVALMCALVVLLGLNERKRRKAARHREEAAAIRIGEHIADFYGSKPISEKNKDDMLQTFKDFGSLRRINDEFGGETPTQLLKAYTEDGKFQTVSFINFMYRELKDHRKVMREVAAEARAERAVPRYQPAASPQASTKQFKFYITERDTMRGFWEYVTARHDNEARQTIEGRYPASRYRYMSHGSS